MLFETIIIIFLNVLFGISILYSFFYKNYCKHVIEYLTDINTVSSISNGILPIEEVKYVFLRKSGLFLRMFFGVFIFNIFFYINTYFAYKSGIPLNTLSIFMVSIFNMVGIFSIFLTIDMTEMFISRLFILHSTVILLYEQEIENIEIHKILKSFIKKHETWMGNLIDLKEINNNDNIK
jgi:hypothetical protein